jgi:hypothetical protein
MIYPDKLRAPTGSVFDGLVALGILGFVFGGPGGI